MSDATLTRYSTVAIVLHWATALLVIFMIIFGEDLMKGGEDDPSAGTFLPSIHVSIGASILVLTLLRLVWRLFNPPPPYATAMKPWELVLSKVTHAVFYVLLVAVPLAG